MLYAFLDSKLIIIKIMMILIYYIALHTIASHVQFVLNCNQLCWAAMYICILYCNRIIFNSSDHKVPCWKFTLYCSCFTTWCEINFRLLACFSSVVAIFPSSLSALSFTPKNLCNPAEYKNYSNQLEVEFCCRFGNIITRCEQ